MTGIVDASKEGVGGVVFGITHECVPTVFRMEWPKEVRDQLQTEENPGGTITNSDLEMAGLVLIWLVIEFVVKNLRHKHVLSSSVTTAHQWDGWTAWHRRSRQQRLNSSER